MVELGLESSRGDELMHRVLKVYIALMVTAFIALALNGRISLFDTMAFLLALVLALYLLRLLTTKKILEG